LTNLYEMNSTPFSFHQIKLNASSFNDSGRNASRDCFTPSTNTNVYDTLYQVNDVVRQVVPPLFLLIGIPGNLLTMAVILRQGMTNSFTGASLVVLAVVDNIFILAYSLPEWLGAVADLDFRDFSNTSCRMAMFFTYISFTVSPWVLVAITVERVVCLVWPFKAKTIFTPKSSLCVHALLFAGAIAVSVYAFEVFEISERALNVYGTACGTFAHLDSSDVTSTVLNHISSGMRFHVPFVLLIIGNSVIFRKLSARINFSAERGDATTTARYRSLSRLVITLNALFFFSMFPLSVYVLIDAQIIDWAFSSSRSDQFCYRLSINRLLFAFCNVMALVNHSTNFLLYFVSSDTFRKEIRAFLMCQKGGGRNLFKN